MLGTFPASIPSWGLPYGSQGISSYSQAPLLPPVGQLLQMVAQQLQQLQQLHYVEQQQLQQIHQVLQIVPQQLQQHLAQQTAFGGSPGAQTPAGIPFQVIPQIGSSIFPAQPTQLM